MIIDNQWYLTKLVGEQFFNTSIPAMSMISHEIRNWDISVVQMIQVMQMIQVIEVIQVIQERLAYLWCESTLELFFSASLIHIRHPHNMRPYICNAHLDFALPSISKGWQCSYVKDDFVSKLHFVCICLCLCLKKCLCHSHRIDSE